MKLVEEIKFEYNKELGDISNETDCRQYFCRRKTYRKRFSDGHYNNKGVQRHLNKGSAWRICVDYDDSFSGSFKKQQPNHYRTGRNPSLRRVEKTISLLEGKGYRLHIKHWHTILLHGSPMQRVPQYIEKLVGR